MKNQKEEIINYIKTSYNAVPEYLWEKFPNHCIFRHSNNKKWFALIASVSKNKLNEQGNELVDILNLKLDTFEIDLLNYQQGFMPAYHMNKKYWITAKLDGTIPNEILEELIDHSYDITKTKIVRKNI